MYKTSVGLDYKGSRHIPFAVPMIWMELTDPINHCYFCLPAIKGITTKLKHTIKCPDMSSAKRSIPHSAKLPVWTSPLDTQKAVAIKDDNLETDCDSTYRPSTWDVIFSWKY